MTLTFSECITLECLLEDEIRRMKRRSFFQTPKRRKVTKTVIEQRERLLDKICDLEREGWDRIRFTGEWE